MEKEGEEEGWQQGTEQTKTEDGEARKKWGGEEIRSDKGKGDIC